MSTLQIGVIGCGGRGGIAKLAHEHLIRGAKVVAGCSDYQPHLDAFRETYGDNVFTTTDYREILQRNDIDAVFITTPDYLHEEMACDALDAGKAVYLEKPMAITIQGCDRILKRAYETGSKLFVGHNMRHFPSILKMKEIIDSGRIGHVQAVWCRHFIAYGGDAYFKDWHSEQQYTNSLLLQKGAHDIDVIHWLADGYTQRVVGMGKLSVHDKCKERRSPEERGDTTWKDGNWPPTSQTGLSPVIDVEDHNMLMMQLDNGVQVSYTQCHYTPDSCRNFTFIGTQGRIENIGDQGECHINIYADRHCRFGQPNHTHHLFETEGTHGGSDPAIIDEFIRFVKDGVKTNTSPIAARNCVVTGVLGAESMRQGNIPKDIPPLDADLIEYFESGQQRR